MSNKCKKPMEPIFAIFSKAQFHRNMIPGKAFRFYWNR